MTLEGKGTKHEESKQKRRHLENFKENLAVYLELRRLGLGLPEPEKIRAGHPKRGTQKMPVV